MDWQPIETAPKDGTTIDIWQKAFYNDGRPSVGNRYTDAYYKDGQWRHYSCGNCSSEDDYLESEWRDGKEIVTHWMSSPSPPQE